MRSVAAGKSGGCRAGVTSDFIVGLGCLIIGKFLRNPGGGWMCSFETFAQRHRNSAIKLFGAARTRHGV